MIAVVGAGIGGLSAALHLARAGHEVAVFDRQDHPGGVAVCFHRGPYRFDASLHRLDAVGPGESTRRAFEELDLDVTLLTETEPRLERWPGFDLRIGVGAAAWVEALSEVFPRHRHRLEQLAEQATRVHDALERNELSDEVLALRHKTAAQHMELPADVAQVAGTVASYLGCAPDRISAITWCVLLHRYQVLTPGLLQGGSQALTDALVARLKALGVPIHLGNPLEQLGISGDRVHTLTVGGSHHVDAVVGAIAPHHLVAALPDGARRQRWARRLERGTLSTSVLKVWLGVSEPPDLPYEALIHGDQRIGVHLPHRVDPTVCPPGHGLVSVIRPVPAAPIVDLHAAAERMVEQAAERLGCSLTDHVVERSTAGPRTIEQFCGAPRGAALGWDATPAQSGVRRMTNRTPLDNLVLAGCWTRPGSGLAATLISGRFAAERVKTCLP